MDAFDSDASNATQIQVEQVSSVGNVRNRSRTTSYPGSMYISMS